MALYRIRRCQDMRVSMECKPMYTRSGHVLHNQKHVTDHAAHFDFFVTNEISVQSSYIQVDKITLVSAQRQYTMADVKNA